MCVIYTVRFLCHHLVHLDNPPATPCSKIRSPNSKNPNPPTIYCPMPLLPTIIRSDQVCRVCSAGLLAYARRVYYFEVGCMILKLPVRVRQEQKLYFGDEEDGEDRSLYYYEKNIIDRILAPQLLLKCWQAWRKDRDRFRKVGVIGGFGGEVGMGFRFDGGGGRGEGGEQVSRGGRSTIAGPRAGRVVASARDANTTSTSTRAKAKAKDAHDTITKTSSSASIASDYNSHPRHPRLAPPLLPQQGKHQTPTPPPTPKPRFPNTYFFDDFLGPICPTAAVTPEQKEAEKRLKKKLSLLDAIVEARCLEAYVMEKDQADWDVWIPILRRAARIRRWCLIRCQIGDWDRDEDGDGGMGMRKRRGKKGGLKREREGEGEGKDGEIEEGGGGLNHDGEDGEDDGDGNWDGDEEGGFQDEYQDEDDAKREEMKQLEKAIEGLGLGLGADLGV